MDVRMPGMGGIEAARRICERGGATVVMMSSDPTLLTLDDSLSGDVRVVRKERFCSSALRALPYTDETVVELLGDDGPAAGLTDVAVYDRPLTAERMLEHAGPTRVPLIFVPGTEGTFLENPSGEVFPNVGKMITTNDAYLNALALDGPNGTQPPGEEHDISVEFDA